MSKTVLITGGSRGIGREMVRTFSEKGYRVAFTYHTSCDEAALISTECNAIGFKVDFEDISSVIRFSETVEKEFGEIDVLINNAGVSHYGLFQDISLSDFQKVFQINFESMFFLTQKIVSTMIRRKEGSVINISSVWGQTGASTEVLYSSTKAAIIGFTKALAKEIAPSGICANCIAPGVVDTDMMASFSEAEKNALCDEIPTGKFTKTAEVAKLALFLAENDCESLTGQVIGINGGMYC